jgi:hypothetical protein
MPFVFDKSTRTRSASSSTTAHRKSREITPAGRGTPSFSTTRSGKSNGSDSCAASGPIAKNQAIAHMPCLSILPHLSKLTAFTSPNPADS